MKTANIFYGLAATALLGSLSVAQAAHLPSPCSGGEVGDGTNCMYLVANGAVYDSGTGDRSAMTSLTFGIDVWMDFGQTAVQGGGFDVLMNMANVSAMSWVWSADIVAGDRSLDGSQTGAGWEGIQFDNFGGDGYGGTTGSKPGFILVGTLNVTLDAASNLLISLAQPYLDNTYPNCFAPGPNSGATGCVATNFYDLTVDAAPVPVPAAIWLMIAGISSLAGFSRRS